MHPEPALTDGRDEPVPLARGLFLGLGAALLVGGLLLGFALLTRDDSSGGDAGPRTGEYHYVIPAGTGLDLDRGARYFTLFPDYLEVKVGDRIVIENKDDRQYALGPFTLRPFETLDYTFEQPGTYRGLCDVHGGGHEAVIVVT